LIKAGIVFRFKLIRGFILKKLIYRSARYLSASAKYNPVMALSLTWMSYLLFTIAEAQVETLIWGDRFEHWLDPVFLVLLALYQLAVIEVCAIMNETKKDEEG
jgi:hypothetical protein